MDVMIVDDEPAARRTLRECCAAEPDLRVVAEFGDGRTALEAIRARPPQLLFLDIQMDTMSGIEVARRLDPQALPAIVFVTAYDQYALQAFEVHATDYLLKPFDEERFRRTVDRVRRQGQPAAPQRHAALDAVLSQLERLARPAAERRPRLLAESGGALHLLDVGDIELVESDRNYVRIRVGRDSFHARSTLAQAELALGEQPMLRISRSCLVNMNHVREVSRTLRGDFILVLAGGATVTSSEGFRERVREYLETLKL
jgi:two-component system LytT family response regulator